MSARAGIGRSPGPRRFSRSAAVVVSCLAFLSSLEAQGTYTTSFPLTENPISEGGNWLNGGTNGLDWADVKTVGGNAVGTQIKNAHYNDSTAVLTGNWAANQRVRCTVFKNNPSSAGQPEVEIRLRSVVGAHVNRGYEILFSTNGLYDVQIVRWDGLDDFHYINGNSSQHVLADGDVVEAEIVGGHIKAWLNGTLITEADDSTWTDGNPGVGFWNVAGSQVENGKFGFKDFTASGGSVWPPFTDDPLIPASTVVRGVHVSELRTRIDAIRVRYQLPAYSWADPDIQAGTTVVRAVHLADLRTALLQAYAAAGLTSPTFTDPVVTAGLKVKAVHISELRAAVVVLQ